MRTTYFRTTNATTGNTTARINSWVKAPITATVELSGIPQANQNEPMTFDDVSTFFRRVTLNAVNGLFVPDQVTVTARSANGLETVQSVSVVDQVNITVATWTKATGEIKIVAISSDKISPTVGAIPELTLHIGCYVSNAASRCSRAL